MVCYALYSTLLLALLGSHGQGQRLAEDDKCSLDEATQKLHEQLGYSFTVERREGQTSCLSQLSSRMIAEPKGLANADDVMKYLRAQLPHVVVEADEKLPAVIHLIDAALADDKKYPLPTKISLKYQGTPAELVEELGKLKYGKIEGPRSGVIGDSTGDYITSISVDADKLSIRSVLSDFIPTRDYHPILWIADMRPTEADDLVFVRHNGPLPAKN